MSYNYLTQFDSPNYTPASETRRTWGVDRQIRHIDIHWWGDPAQNPTIEGIIATFLNPASQRSAHFIATGTGRRVACLISPQDNSWATVQDNPYSISIECDPRCRDEDYDVVAELIADIRSAYGDNLELHPHREFLNTACPGNWDLARLDALSRTKVSQAQWGQVTDANPAPITSVDQIKQAYRDILERDADQGGIDHYISLGWNIDQIRNDLNNSTERSALLNRKAAEAAAAIAVATPVDKQPQKENPYVRFDNPMSLAAANQPTTVYDTTGDATQVVKQLNKGDEFIAVGKYKHQNGNTYFMTAFSFGSADTTGQPAHPYGIKTVDLTQAPAAPIEATPVTPPTPPAPETPAAPVENPDGSFSVPVNVIPADPNKWQSSFVPYGRGDYIARVDAIVKDLAGEKPNVQLVRSQNVKVAGEFVKDGVSYYRTENSVLNNNWYGIPVKLNGIDTLVEDDNNFFDTFLHDEANAIAREVETSKEKAIKAVANMDGFFHRVLHKK